MEYSPHPTSLPGDPALTLTLSTTSCPPSPSSSAQYQLSRRDDGCFPLQRGQRYLKPDERGIRLVQILLACAAHVGAGDFHRADYCLGQISALSSPSGDTMQRLASRFAAALAARLLRLRWPGLLSALESPLAGGGVPAARLVFARALPYVPFARAVASGTVLRAVAHEGAVHIVGLGWQRDPGLWTALLRGFCSQRRGPLHLRVTLVDSDEGALESQGSVFLKEANLADIPLRFDAVNAPLRELDAGMLKVGAGEAVVVVSILGLHELLAEPDDVDPRESNLHRFLSGLRSRSLAAVVAVEQEADTNAATVGDRFVEGLHYYSALFDSLDSAATAGLLAAGERQGVEEMLGREVENVVAREGRERVERHERAGRWAARFGRAGFKPAALWRGALDEAKQVVDSYRADGVGGYSLAAEGGRATICWHDRPMFSVSAWQC